MPDNVRVVELERGGRITLSANINLFDLTLQDRNLIKELVAILDDYEACVSSPQASTEGDGLAKVSTLNPDV